MSADEAAALIEFGTRIGMSGFTGSGYPKAVPMSLARRISDAHLRGDKCQVSIFTGASTGPELDGALALAGGIHLRLPYQSDPETRKRINAGEMEYMDIHLGHVAQYVESVSYTHLLPMKSAWRSRPRWSTNWKKWAAGIRPGCWKTSRRVL